MAKKIDEKKNVIIKKDIRHKILVEEGGRMNSDIPYKVIHSEFAPNIEKTKERVAILKAEYPNCSICYFSV